MSRQDGRGAIVQEQVRVDPGRIVFKRDIGVIVGVIESGKRVEINKQDQIIDFGFLLFFLGFFEQRGQGNMRTVSAGFRGDSKERSESQAGWQEEEKNPGSQAIPIHVFNVHFLAAVVHNDCQISLEKVGWG
jgi:hypothetical protein